MKIYSQDFLKRLNTFVKAHDIHLISDEIMTGLGRTGKMLAIEHAAGVVPDFICLGKGLTAGFLPFSATLIHEDLYQYFYDDYSSQKNFLHSHTFSGYALGARVALEVLTMLKTQNWCEKVETLGEKLKEAMLEIALDTKHLENVRQIGAIVAADLVTKDLVTTDFDAANLHAKPLSHSSPSSRSHPNPRLGFHIAKEALKRGALIRPLGNALYWFPPFNIEAETLDKLKEITRASILSVCGE